MIDVTEILTHWHAGRSLSEMSESLDVDRKTLRKYIAPAVGAGIAPGGPELISPGAVGAERFDGAVVAYNSRSAHLAAVISWISRWALRFWRGGEEQFAGLVAELLHLGEQVA